MNDIREARRQQALAQANYQQQLLYGYQAYKDHLGPPPGFIHDAVSGLRTREVTLHGGGELKPVDPHPVKQIVSFDLEPYKARLARLAVTATIEPKPDLGGDITRKLFAGMFPAPIVRYSLPNNLWLVTSLAMLAIGIWMVI